jgi:hypothetical protein
LWVTFHWDFAAIPARPEIGTGSSSRLCVMMVWWAGFLKFQVLTITIRSGSDNNSNSGCGDVATSSSSSEAATAATTAATAAAAAAATAVTVVSAAAATTAAATAAVVT